MPARIEPTDLTRIVENLARQGKPAPGWVTDDPKLDAAYRQAASQPPAEHQDSPAGRRQAATPGEAPKAGQPHAAGRAPAAAARAPRRSPAKPRRARPRAASTRRTPRPAGPVPLPRILTKAAHGSAAGGLFLAIFLYPIAAAVLKNGPAGLGMWLKAKFLNITPTQPAAPPPFEHQQDLGKQAPNQIGPNPVLGRRAPATYAPPNPQWGTPAAGVAA